MPTGPQAIPSPPAPPARLDGLANKRPELAAFLRERIAAWGASTAMPALPEMTVSQSPAGRI